MGKYLVVIATVSFAICSLFTVASFLGFEKYGEQQSAKAFHDDPQG
ncbi:hypothetical protein [Brevibacillus laterosporus]|uniref:Uncharacterized protein n=1 Tax=Brevibacillus laterosporus TaxID=1465 RepID=A0AAP3DLR5_BRELA|nr:hypothetical protein [Brevibacillus laterosporus]MCR8982826.1 hypothetical protein [Brevibacillus laterosporus]MCZ0809982.1 hypothetical protein [Brevibacillus laterosporus]MCZ0828606.1 hypothetical protein [Brevibacillus laterosporus]MCZ0852651.1 hypothetical protein [Brevibacillus laterosporus]